MQNIFLRERTATGTMPENPALVTTIVTTNMTAPITEAYGVKRIEVLTGFKYIGEQIKLFEQTGLQQLCIWSGRGAMAVWLVLTQGTRMQLSQLCACVK